MERICDDECNCAFQQRRQANIERINQLMPALLAMATDAADKKDIGTGVRGITYEAAGGPGTRDTAIALVMEAMEENVQQELTTSDLRLADTLIETQELIAKKAREDCRGITEKRRYGLFGDKIITCSSPTAKAHMKLGNDDVFDSGLAFLQYRIAESQTTTPPPRHSSSQ